jgi:hypothetical protein
MANVDENDVLDADALNELYQWIDAVPLSRPKKNIARDFSDGGIYILTKCMRIFSVFVQINKPYKYMHSFIKFQFQSLKSFITIYHEPLKCIIMELSVPLDKSESTGTH